MRPQHNFSFENNSQEALESAILYHILEIALRHVSSLVLGTLGVKPSLSRTNPLQFIIKAMKIVISKHIFEFASPCVPSLVPQAHAFEGNPQWSEGVFIWDA